MTDEATPTPAAEPANPITAENVVSRPEQPSAPDASVLSGSLQAAFPEQNTQPAEPTTAQLQEQMRAIESLLRPKETAKPDPNELATSKIRDLERGYEKLQEELHQRDQMQMMQEAERETSKWVSSQTEHFPLINEAGFQGVVFAKIQNVKEETGRLIDAATAGQMVEQELSDLLARVADKAGYVKRDEQTARREEAQVSVTTPELQVDLPPDMENKSKEEVFQHLKRLAERQYG